MSVSHKTGLRFGALMLGAVVVCAPAVRAFQDAAPDPEEQAAEAMDRLKDAVADRDAAAVQQLLRALDEVYGSVQPKTVKKIGAAVTRLFKDFVPRVEIDVPVTAPLPGDEPEPVNMDAMHEVLACYTLAVGIMHDKPEGADVLLPLLKLKHVKDLPRTTALVIEGLGYRRDPQLTKTLASYLGDAAPEVAGAAAGALAQLQDHPQADRVVAVKAILDAFDAAATAVEKEQRRTKPDDPHPAADHLSLLEVPFGEALKSLTRQRFDTPAEWRTWFAEHGKETDW
jgi:hypothetical protein